MTEQPTEEQLTYVEKKTITEISEYVKDFIDKRFPDGMPENLREILSDCVLDAFHDGSRWCEQQIKEESRIIVDI